MAEHSIEVVGKGAFDPAETYPRMVDAEGDAPPQYEGQPEQDEEWPPVAPEHLALGDVEHGEVGAGVGGGLEGV